MLDKAFYEEEVKRLCLAFEQQVSISVKCSCLFRGSILFISCIPHFPLTRDVIFHLPTCSSITGYFSPT